MTLGNILLFVVIGVVIYMMMRKGGGCCGGHDHGGNNNHGGHGGSGNNNDTGHAHHHREIEAFGSKADKDPVCRMEVQDQTITSSHMGKTFHFCSEQCREIFDLNPNKYAGA